MLTLFIVIVLAMTLVTVCYGSPPRRAPTQCTASRPARHQIHATRQATSQGSPWSRRVVVRGGR
jgi:hypothetical protein